jgi:NAD(P)-dependent dehydrogenase (short-subunit alcohol dehydrogenase family)
VTSTGASRLSLNGRVAVITGAGTRIGRGVALVLAEHGADIVLAGLDQRRWRRRRTRSRSSAARPGRPYRGDRRRAVRKLVSRTVADLGRLDILVNNAGGASTNRSRTGLRRSGTK